jgi:translation initiation factor 2D
MYKTLAVSKSECLTWAECVAVLDKYLEHAGITASDGEVALDEMLQSALFIVAGGKKKEDEIPKKATREEMEAKLKERLQLHTVVEVEGLPQYVKKGELQKIQIATARKGAHNITRCTGLETFSIDPETTAKDLKKLLSCTTSVEELPGKNVKEKLLQMQGHAQNELVEYLKKEYNIPEKYIELKIK